MSLRTKRKRRWREGSPRRDLRIDANPVADDDKGKTLMTGMITILQRLSRTMLRAGITELPDEEVEDGGWLCLIRREPSYPIVLPFDCSNSVSFFDFWTVETPTSRACILLANLSASDSSQVRPNSLRPFYCRAILQVRAEDNESRQAT